MTVARPNPHLSVTRAEGARHPGDELIEIVDRALSGEDGRIPCGRPAPHLALERLSDERGSRVGGRADETKRWPARIFHPRARALLVLKWRNDAVPHERRSPRAPERYAPATFFRAAGALRGGDDSPEHFSEDPDRAKRGTTARRNSASTSLDPRERLLEVRSRGSSDVLGGYPAISRAGDRIWYDDGPALFEVRRTRAGDAWERRRAQARCAPEPDAAPVSLGMPRLRPRAL